MAGSKFTVHEGGNSDGLKSGNGGGTFGSMEARVTAIETKLDRAIEDISGLSSKADTLGRTLSRIEGKLDSKVSWPWILGLIVGQVAMVVGFVIVALRLIGSP